MGKAVTLCAQHDGKLRLSGKSAVVNAYGAVAQSHGSSLEAKAVQLSNSVFRPVGRAGADLRPGYLKHGAHAHTHGTAAQRVAAGRSNEHGIHVQCSGAAEDRSHIGGVHNALQNGHPAGIAADLFHAARQRAAEGAQQNKNKVAKITKEQVRKIAETKMPDLNAANVESAMSMIAGTARSMGIEVVD